MPTIVCGEGDVMRLIGRRLDPEEFAGLLHLAKAELGGAEAGELRIEVQDTNRPDLWCAEGIARQLRSRLTGSAPQYPFFGGAEPAAGTVEVDPNLKEIRPVVGAFIARGVKVDEPTLIQIIQTQEKLCEGYGHRRREAAMGVYDASSIRFPVRYRAAVPAETRFIPLGFDRAMALTEICAEHPKGQEYRRLVEGKPFYPLLEDSAGVVLSFPPVINSRALGEVEVGDDNLFVEVTGYSMRIVAHVCNIMAVNLADRGWEIVPVKAVFPYDTALGREVVIPYDLSRTVEVKLSAVNRLLGLALGEEEAARLLASYGVEARARAGLIAATCPPYRADYMHPVDVIEDIAIAHGYDSFDVVMPETFTVARLAPLTLLADRVRNELIGYGFQEVFSNILMGREEVCGKLRLEEALVEIENFVSETYSVLRNRLLASLLRVEAKSSTTAPYPHRTFEVGEVAIFDLNEPHGSRTEEHVGALIASAEASFSEIHSSLDALLYYLAKPYALEMRDYPFAIEGRAASIAAGGEEIGFIAEVHPEVLTTWGIEVPIAAFELSLNALLD